MMNHSIPLMKILWMIPCGKVALVFLCTESLARCLWTPLWQMVVKAKQKTVRWRPETATKWLERSSPQEESHTQPLSDHHCDLDWGFLRDQLSYD
ncbi:unnamed protein product [Gulo gulo]|uniref:Uncharacterized protein n=1 Tax=Gulo gulo TaxID=48420 RepID=A0A9X9M454_GULGU|nr:unnamed protein product [Gulo gulo]